VSTTKEHQMLAVMAGQVSSMDVDRSGSQRGAAIENAARADLALPVAPSGNGSFLNRIKAALAA
ncbi:MAG: hypothetical protein L0H93_08385, partial [Nocardioides sp.]|nr:hypothetical protein [Nocardioides sp.]